MTLQFFETGLWSTSDYNDESDNPRNLDDTYCVFEISQELTKEAETLIEEFMKRSTEYFTDNELTNSPIAHDLWLTIEGHGSGFWDGDYTNGDKLTEICKELVQNGSTWGEKLNNDLLKDEK